MATYPFWSTAVCCLYCHHTFISLIGEAGLQIIFKKAISRKFSPDSLLSLEQNLTLDIILKN